MPRWKSQNVVDRLSAEAIAEEAARRNILLSDLLKSATQEQRQFITDQSLLSAALCSRRAGKTWAAALALVIECIMYPGCTCVFASLSRVACKNIIQKQLTKLDAKFHLGLKFNLNDLQVIFPNRSSIQMYGLNSTPQEADKVLGQTINLCVIDECASFRQDLERIVYTVIKPSFETQPVKIRLIGTPGWNTRNLFYEVTTYAKKPDGKLKHPNWSVHRWLATQNPYTRKTYLEEVQAYKDAYPNYDELPYYQQMYLATWFEDTSQYVYKYNEDRNLFAGDVSTFRNEQDKYFFFLGVDLGWEDETAFTVYAYRKNTNQQFVVHCEKAKHMLVSATSDRIKALMRKYPFAKMCIDASAKQVVEELRQKYNLPLEPADKTAKEDFIEILNSDLLAGHIKFALPGSQPLLEEIGNLIWDRAYKERTGKRREDQSRPNHCCDSFLYVWRYAKHRYFPQQPKATTSKYDIDYWMDHDIDNELKKDKEPKYWDKNVSKQDQKDAKWWKTKPQTPKAKR